MYDVQLKKTLFIPIHRIDKTNPYVWKYINDESNFISHRKGTYIEVDKAGEFDIHEFETLESFDKYIKEQEYEENFGADTIRYHREILSYILSLNLNEDFEKIVIAYDW